MTYEALAAAAAGGLLWLDRFQVFRIMVSRPIVAAPLVGWAAGDLGAGLASGLLYELLWLRRPPVGGYIPPDGTLASVATAGASAIVRADLGTDVTATVFLSFLVLFPVAFLGSRVDHLLRVEVGKLARRGEHALASEHPTHVYGLIVGALGLEFFVISTVLFCVISAGSLVIDEVGRRLSPATLKAFAVAFYIVPLVGVADMVIGVQGRKSAILFVCGLAAALALGYFFAW